MDKYPGYPRRKIFGIILKVNFNKLTTEKKKFIIHMTLHHRDDENIL